MGITIHYRGSFKPSASLQEMIVEVKDIADVYRWPYRIYKEEFEPDSFRSIEFNKDLYGISFVPPECEPVSLTFLSNGRMSSATNIMFRETDANPEEEKYLYMLFTKTQYAGPETHKMVANILKYIGEKYLNDFEAMDEGGYMENSDEKLLDETFKKYNMLLKDFSDALLYNPRKTGENFEEYFKNLIAKIHASLKSNSDKNEDD